MIDEMSDDIREQLAVLAHEQWSGWMGYIFSKCYDEQEVEYKPNERYCQKIEITSRGLIIPTRYVKRWFRQMTTNYKDLSEQEKESDRSEADKIIELLKDET